MTQDTRIPSATYDRYWLVSVCDQYVFKKEQEQRRSGKWLIFDRPIVIDYYWKLIKSALQSGKLGHSAKVSTSKINPNSKDKSKRVICIFTEDYNDKDDLQKVEQEIRNLGIKNRLIYKLDSDIGKYENNGSSFEVNHVSEITEDMFGTPTITGSINYSWIETYNFYTEIYYIKVKNNSSGVISDVIIGYLNIMKHMICQGYLNDFRVGTSLYSLVLSRSIEHHLREDQKRIRISMKDNNRVVAS